MPIEKYLSDGDCDLRVYCNQHNCLVLEIKESEGYCGFNIAIDTQEDVDFLINEILEAWIIAKRNRS